MTSYICVNIGCSSFLFIGVLAAWVGDSLQRLATTGILYLGLFSLLRWKAPTAGSGTPPLTKPNQKDWILLVSPTLFAKFNLPQHRLALRSNKREAKGRSALKATLEEEGEKRDVQTSFLWTKESVVQMFEGKQGNYLSVGAVPHWIAVLYWKFKAVRYS